MPRETRNVTSFPPGLGDRATGSPSSENGTFRKEGEYWTVGYGNTAFRLKDTKGFAYLAHLLGLYTHSHTTADGLRHEKIAERKFKRRRELCLITSS
jgi:hypothetical protein